MKKDNEQYKRIIRIFLVVVLVACETSFFMYSWIKSYNLYTVFPFFQKCHCMMAGSTVDSRNSGVNIIKIRNIVDNDSPVFIAFYIFIRNNIQCPDK